MSNFQVLDTVLTIMAFAISLLSAHILYMRKQFPDVHLPLMYFFLANAIAEISALPGLFEVGEPSVKHGIILSGLPAMLFLAPAIWKYIVALTSEEATPLRWKDCWHLIPFFLGLGVCMIVASLPIPIREHILGDVEVKSSPELLMVKRLLVGIILVNLMQLAGYMVSITIRLLRYSARLKDLYANMHNRTLGWVIWILILLAANVAFIFFSTFFTIDYTTDLLGEFANLTLIWMFAVWSLQQAPGLRPGAVVEFAPSPNTLNETKADKRKYERSALSESHMLQIVEKVEQAMQREQLYLDPNLSLRDLSKFVSTHPNYVSQALNSQVKVTFFDYINGWRIREAQPRLLDSDEQVTNIAHDVGFNSRSAFYRAFKKETGQTPTQYRQTSREPFVTNSTAPSAESE